LSGHRDRVQLKAEGLDIIYDVDQESGFNFAKQRADATMRFLSRLGLKEGVRVFDAELIFDIEDVAAREGPAGCSDTGLPNVD